MHTLAVTANVLDVGVIVLTWADTVHWSDEVKRLEDVHSSAVLLVTLHILMRHLQSQYIILYCLWSLMLSIIIIFIQQN